MVNERGPACVFVSAGVLGGTPSEQTTGADDKKKKSRRKSAHTQLRSPYSSFSGLPSQPRSGGFSCTIGRKHKSRLFLFSTRALLPLSNESLLYISWRIMKLGSEFRGPILCLIYCETVPSRNFLFTRCPPFWFPPPTPSNKSTSRRE